MRVNAPLAFLNHEIMVQFHTLLLVMGCCGLENTCSNLQRKKLPRGRKRNKNSLGLKTSKYEVRHMV